MSEKRQALQTQGTRGRRKGGGKIGIAYVHADDRIRNYTLSDDGLCHRTEVAARIRTLRPRQWEKYVQGNLPENARRDSEASAFIAECVLEDYAKEAKRALEILKGMKCEMPPDTLFLLERRWEQITLLIANTLYKPSKTNK